MLLVIHNLPSDVTYVEIKSLLHTECGFTDVLLDNLVTEGLTKRVTVGVVDENDAAILLRKINGLYLGELQLYVEDVRKKKVSEQSFISSKSVLLQHSNYEPNHRTNQRDTLGNQGMQGPNASLMNQAQMPMMMKNIIPMGGIYNMPQMPIVPSNQSSFMGFNNQSQQIPSRMPQVPEVRARQEPYGYRSGVEENRPREPFEGLSRRDEPQFETSLDSRTALNPAYTKFHNDTPLVERINSSQNYHEQTAFGRAEPFSLNTDSMQSNIFGDHVTKFPVNNHNFRRDQPRKKQSPFYLPHLKPQKSRKDNAQTNAQKRVQNKQENEPNPKKFASIPESQKADAPNNGNQIDPSPTSITNDDDAWRRAATNNITRQIINDLKTTIHPFYAIFSYLKRNIRARIDVILRDVISKSTEDVIHQYRSKFPKSGDQKFFDAIVEAYEHSEEKRAEMLKAERELTPALNEALEKETDIISDVFMSECLKPDSEKDEHVCEQIADVVSDDFRQIIADQLTEQLLHRQQNHLVVLGFCAVNKPVRLKEYLEKNYGAVWFKKAARSKRQLIVFLDTYANYERLIKKATVKLGNAVVHFKPYQDLEPLLSARLERKRIKKLIENLEDKCSGSESLLEPGYTCYPTVDPQTYNVGDLEDSQNDEVQENNVDQVQENDPVDENNDEVQENNVDQVQENDPVDENNDEVQENNVDQVQENEPVDEDQEIKNEPSDEVQGNEYDENKYYNEDDEVGDEDEAHQQDLGEDLNEDGLDLDELEDY